MVGLLLIALLVWAWWQVRGQQRVTIEAAFTATAQARAPLNIPPADTPTPSPTVTPTATSTMTSTPTPTSTPHIYVVQPNDTLLALAAQFGVPVERLAAANHLRVEEGLKVGQRLIIPPPEGGLPPTATPTPYARIINYTVQEGDTVVLVAERFQTSVDLILRANNLQPGDILRPGTVLVVPVGTPQPTPTPTPFSSPTPTPGPPYPAPILILPPDGATFEGEGARVLLAWTAVGYLRPGEVYRLTLAAGPSTWTFDTRQTFFVLPSQLRADIQRAGGVVRWSVQVMDTSERPSSSRSHPSEERTFVWR